MFSVHLGMGCLPVPTPGYGAGLPRLEIPLWWGLFVAGLFRAPTESLRSCNRCFWYKVFLNLCSGLFYRYWEPHLENYIKKVCFPKPSHSVSNDQITFYLIMVKAYRELLWNRSWDPNLHPCVPCGVPYTGDVCLKYTKVNNNGLVKKKIIRGMCLYLLQEEISNNRLNFPEANIHA